MKHITNHKTKKKKKKNAKLEGKQYIGNEGQNISEVYRKQIESK